MNITDLKIELYNEYLKENPSQQEKAAFYKALVWVEDAMLTECRDSLNKEVPDQIALSYLQQQLHKAQAEICCLKKELAEKQSRIRQFLEMDKAGRRKLRVDDRAIYLQEQVKRLEQVNYELIQKLNKLDE